MSKPSSLIWLINSLSKSEKKSISETFCDNSSDHIVLYNVLSRTSATDTDEVRRLFGKKRPGASFHLACTRLFDILVTHLARLNRTKDTETDLLMKLAEARTLFNKDIYDEAFTLIQKLKRECILLEKEYLLFIVRRTELDFLLALGFPDMTEQELLNRQVKINDSLKVIRKMNEHSSIYELLRFRTDNKGSIKSDKSERDQHNDLVVSEMGISSGLGSDKFSIRKVHQLFQSKYLLHVGDYRSALNSFNHLNKLFEKNRHLLKNPPVDYLSTLEGILESLRSIRKYSEMEPFIGKLTEIETEHQQFQMELCCVIYLYRLFPHIDRGDFRGGTAIYEQYADTLHAKTHLLPVSRQLQLSLYNSILFLGAGLLPQAQKSLARSLIYDKNLYTKEIYKASRLVRLIVRYEKGDYDFIYNESRSIKREIRTEANPFRLEQLMLKVLNKQATPMSRKDKQKYYERLSPQIEEIRQSKHEYRLLRIFDFLSWTESKLTGTPLSELLAGKDK